MLDAKEEELVPSTSAQSLSALGSDGKKQTAGAAGSVAASRSQPNFREYSKASAMIRERDPSPVITLPSKLELQRNVLIELLWEFHDWLLLQFLPGQAITTNQRAQLDRRIEAADQWLRAVAWERVTAEVPKGVSYEILEEFEEKFLGVYNPVMIRARKIRDSPTVVPQIDDVPRRARNDVMEPPPPETAIDVQPFVGNSLEDVMSRLLEMGDVRYVEATRNLRDDLARLMMTPPALDTTKQK